MILQKHWGEERNDVLSLGKGNAVLEIRDIRPYKIQSQVNGGTNMSMMRSFKAPDKIFIYAAEVKKTSSNIGRQVKIRHLTVGGYFLFSLIVE